MYLILYWILGQAIHLLTEIIKERVKFKESKKKFKLNVFFKDRIYHIILALLCFIVLVLAWEKILVPNFKDQFFMNYQQLIAIVVGYTGSLLVINALNKSSIYLNEVIVENTFQNTQINTNMLQEFPGIDLQEEVVSIDQQPLSQTVIAADLPTIDQRFTVNQGMLYIESETTVYIELRYPNGTTHFIGSRPVRH